jgi:chorismate mutase
MTKDLRIRKEKGDAVECTTKITRFRTEIDLIDSQLMLNYGKRMRIADSIGEIKRENNVAILQTRRWNEVLDRMKSIGSEENLSEDFITEVFKAIHQESIQHQQQVISSSKKSNI